MGGLRFLVTAALHLDGHLLPPRHAIAICCAVLRVQVEHPLCEKGLEALLQIKQAHAVSKLVLRHLPHCELLVKAEDLVRGLVRCRWLLHRRRGRGAACAGLWRQLQWPPWTGSGALSACWVGSRLCCIKGHTDSTSQPLPMRTPPLL